MVLIEVIIAADTKTRLIHRVNVICGLMKYLATEGQFIGELLLEQPAEEPVVLIAKIIILVDPIATTSIGRPIAKAFLHPDRQEQADVAGA